jgi:hypothetical protein
MEEMIHEKVLQKENELNATYDEKMRNYEERYVVCCGNTLQFTNASPANKTCNAKYPSRKTNFVTCACQMIQIKLSFWTIVSAKVGGCQK